MPLRQDGARESKLEWRQLLGAGIVEERLDVDSAWKRSDRSQCGELLEGVKFDTVLAANASGGSCLPGASDPCVLGCMWGLAAEWAATKKPMFLNKMDERQ